MKPLVVIDMQPEFKASNDEETLAAVCEEIEMAKARKDPVILVEFLNWKRSHKRVLEALKGYPYHARCLKASDGGGKEVWRKLGLYKAVPEAVRVCGVNTTACVVRTVRQMVQERPEVKIEVVRNACNDNPMGKSDIAWGHFWNRMANPYWHNHMDPPDPSLFKEYQAAVLIV